MNVVIWRKSISNIYIVQMFPLFLKVFFNRIASADSQNHHWAYKKERNISRKIEGNWGENVRFSRTNGHEHLRPDVWLSFAYFYDTTTSILLNIKNTESGDNAPFFQFILQHCISIRMQQSSAMYLCTLPNFSVCALRKVPAK